MNLRFETDPEIRWILVNRQSGFILRGLDKDTIVHTIAPEAPHIVMMATVAKMLQMNDYFESSEWIVTEEKTR